MLCGRESPLCVGRSDLLCNAMQGVEDVLAVELICEPEIEDNISDIETSQSERALSPTESGMPV